MPTDVLESIGKSSQWEFMNYIHQHGNIATQIGLPKLLNGKKLPTTAMVGETLTCRNRLRMHVSGWTDVHTDIGPFPVSVLRKQSEQMAQRPTPVIDDYGGAV